jgi:hypothetical protein
MPADRPLAATWGHIILAPGTGVISTVYFGRIAGKGAAAETAWS